MDGCAGSRQVLSQPASQLCGRFREHDIVVRGARTHNLRNVDVTIPARRLIVVTGVAVVKVSRIDQALRDNNNIHVQVQRYAINFRGSAHDRSIAVRDVVLSPTPAERDKEIATIAALADFYAQSATPLEKLGNRVGAPPELAPLYAGIRSAEAQAVASTQAIIAQVQAGDAQAAQTLWQQAKPQYVQWLAAINKLIAAQARALG